MEWNNPCLDDSFFQREDYGIKDLAMLVDRGTRVIRLWEQRKIITKPPDRYANGWRKYTKETLADTLEMIIYHPWKNDWGLDFEELLFIVSLLRGEYVIGKKYEENYIMKYRVATTDYRPRVFSEHLRRAIRARKQYNIEHERAKKELNRRRRRIAQKESWEKNAKKREEKENQKNNNGNR